MGDFRKNFGRVKKFLDIPNLIEIQTRSYEKFLQQELALAKRGNIGLQGAFKSVFPISDFSGKCSLEFVSYKIGDVRYNEKECIQKGMTFAAPLKIVVRLVVFDTDRLADGKINRDAPEMKPIRDIKEQEIYFGEIPLMTENGTFIVNGTERVIVSQLHRSPGIFFDHDKGKTVASGKLIYSARVIPIRGSWLDLEFDSKDLLYVRIDRRRKMPITILLKAMGNSTEFILNYFYNIEKVTIEGEKLYFAVDDSLVGQKAPEDIKDPKSDETIVKKGRKVTKPLLKRVMDARIKRIVIKEAELAGKIISSDVRDPQTGEIIFRCNEELPLNGLEVAKEKGVQELKFIHIDEDMDNASMRDTLLIDKIDTTEDAIMEIYRRLRPSNPPTPETAAKFFNSLFFEPETYNLSDVGRAKMNYKLHLNVSTDITVLRNEDILAAVKYLIDLKNGIGECSVDDIDHLGNRRVRSVGELIENQYRIGLVRMERAIKEKMSLQDIETMMPHDLINAKPVSAVVNEFFGSSQLSQFMDQTNPLSEITHKRRLSALGPGGLTRERAGFEVRDVHATHYGRICPVETPEGPNIGLIVSLSTYARVNEFGFIETPYKKVKNGRVLDHYEVVTVGDSGWSKGQTVEAEELEETNQRLKKSHKKPAVGRPTAFFQPAWEEENYVIAQANAEVDDKGRFTEDRIVARYNGEFVTVEKNKVEFMDVSPKQLVSVAAALIPFLEHDDANRALMGSNMQRQSVPLLRTEPPLVGTGLEGIVARDSGAVVLCKRDGVVDTVDARRIIVRVEAKDEDGATRDFGADIYPLLKFRRSNQNTCINQKPVVVEGDRVIQGQVLADGPCTSQGELALGRNILVAFMPWRGYNYEDAILISEKMVKEDYYTSIHIEEFEIEARETKLGAEEITKDIPNVSEHALRDLDESGIVRIGANVKPGDILVGKVTPKGETQLTPEEKLLRAIFGEKAGDVRDASLKCPPGIEGIVVEVKIFTRKDEEKQKDVRAKQILDEEVGRLTKNADDEIRIIRTEAKEKIESLLSGRTVLEDVSDSQGNVLVKEGGKLSIEKIGQMTPRMLKGLKLKDEEIRDQVRLILQRTDSQIDVIKKVSADRVALLAKGDELAPGVNKTVNVFVAMKRKLQVGDKMAGRHGNKGVISRILPEEDMPYLPDGTPVEIVLNPLGVPSRMNVGQILETHLGWAAKVLGINIATPVFDGASEEEIRTLLRKADLPVGGKTVLYDGMTGNRFEQEVTVGYIYMLKLSHLVDDKIHARSIGPYSLITQQPLGGKAQFGGQRFGEMEVWALEAYGAAYTLQELLTVKSDDVYGRTKIYAAIVKGEAAIEPGVPESFNVLIRELQSLCLDVELIKTNERKVLAAAPVAAD